MSDKKFMAAFEKNAQTDTEKGILWRTAVLAWAANNAMRLEGDMVECACYRGTSARIIVDYLDLKESSKNFYLYDLFEESNSAIMKLEFHKKGLYEEVVEKFSDVPNAKVCRGFIPNILHEVAPEKISFLHIDLNNAEAEIATLEVLFDRVVPGGVIIFDDYGWIQFAKSKAAEDAWLEKRGYKVLEMPTGQGMVIK